MDISSTCHGMWMTRFAIYLISDLAKLAKVEFLETVSSLRARRKMFWVIVTNELKHFLVVL